MTHVLCPACGKPLCANSIYQTLLDSRETVTVDRRPYCQGCRRSWHPAELASATRAPEHTEQAMMPGFEPTRQRGFWE